MFHYHDLNHGIYNELIKSMHLRDKQWKIKKFICDFSLKFKTCPFDRYVHINNSFITATTLQYNILWPSITNAACVLIYS